MMDFTVSNPVVAGESSGNHFVISSVVDRGARTCDTRIELTRPRDGVPFSEQHRQYFHPDADVRRSLQDAGFAVAAIGEEYTHEPADASTLRATWTARRLSDVSFFAAGAAGASGNSVLVILVTVPAPSPAPTGPGAYSPVSARRGLSTSRMWSSSALRPR